MMDASPHQPYLHSKVNLVNLGSSDHITFFLLLQSPVFKLPSKLFFQLASLGSGFLQATQLFSPNLMSSLYFVHVVVHLWTGMPPLYLRFPPLFPPLLKVFKFKKVEIKKKSGYRLLPFPSPCEPSDSLRDP